MSILSPIRSVFSSDKKLVYTVKNIFGFFPDNVALYSLAFRHKSASQERINGFKVSNERLEYLGDAVLSSIVADYLFKKFPYKEEGFLTEMRSKIVSRSSLNKLSRKLGIDVLVKSEISGNGFSKSLLGDAFEAFVGALYLDKGYDFTKRILIKRVVEVHFDIDKLVEEDTNYKSQLIEWSQKEKIPIEFKVIEEIGNGYGKQYLVEVLVDNKPVATAQDYAIKGAEQLAAEKALVLIDNEKNLIS